MRIGFDNGAFLGEATSTHAGPLWTRENLIRAAELAIGHDYIDEELAHIVRYGHEISVSKKTERSEDMRSCNPCGAPLREGESLSRSLAALNEHAPSTSIFAGLKFDAIGPDSFRIGFDPGAAAAWHQAAVEALLAPPWVEDAATMEDKLRARAMQLRRLKRCWPEDLAMLAESLVREMEEAGLTAPAARLKDHSNRVFQGSMLEVVDRSGTRLIVRDREGSVYIAFPAGEVGVLPPNSD